MSTEKVVLVTGGNGGLGASVAEYLLASGHRDIACHYRGDDKRIGAILKRYGLDPAKHAFFAELTDEASVVEMRDRIEETLGPVDCLVNFAGGSSNGMSWKITKEEFLAVLDTNLTSIFLTCRTFVPAMRRRGWGRIVNVSSVLGSTGVAGASHYSAAKAGVNGFSKSLALEVAKNSITCNVLALGYFDAGIIDQVPPAYLDRILETTPLNRLGQSANEIGGIVKYLIGEDSAFLTGQVLHLNGGLYVG